MNKLKMHSPDLTQANIDKLVAISELFPSCVTEALDAKGVLRKSVNFDQLRQELSDTIVEGPQERYQLNWPGKREALLTANAPIAKTLRPCREESVDFDTTQNLADSKVKCNTCHRVRSADAKQPAQKVSTTPARGPYDAGQSGPAEFQRT